MSPRPLPRLKRRLGAAVLTALLVAGGALVAQPASAATMNGSNVNLRACVNLGNPVCATPVGTTGNAGIVKMRCWRDGSWVTGNYSSNRWFLVMLTDQREGYVHSSFVTNQQSVPECTTLSYVRAADFAIAQVGQSRASNAIASSYSASDWAPGPFGEWSGDCAKFTGSSYRSTGTGYPSGNAISQYQQFRTAGKILQGIPRYGSPVFYNITTYGHTAIYIGGTSIASTQKLDGADLPVAVQDINTYGNYLGYALN
jgi:hypothetical protein